MNSSAMDTNEMLAQTLSKLAQVRPRRRADRACTTCGKNHRRCEWNEGQPRCDRCYRKNLTCSLDTSNPNDRASDPDSDTPGTTQYITDSRGSPLVGSSNPVSTNSGTAHFHAYGQPSRQAVQNLHGPPFINYSGSQRIPPLQVPPTESIPPIYNTPSQSHMAGQWRAPSGPSSSLDMHYQSTAPYSVTANAQTENRESWVQVNAHNPISSTQVPTRASHGYQTQMQANQQRQFVHPSTEPYVYSLQQGASQQQTDQYYPQAGQDVNEDTTDSTYYRQST